MAAVALFSVRAIGAQAAALATGESPRAAYLDLLRTRNDMDQAAAELARAEALLARAMLAPSERDERRAAYVRARLAHLGALLAVEERGARLVIERAVKSRTADGRLRVVLTLRDQRTAPADLLMTGDLRAKRTAAAVPGEPDLVDWSVVRAATVALKVDAGPNGAIISRPYERSVPPLAPGASRTVTLELLEDVTDVVVAVGVGGRTDERRIRLEVASISDAIRVDAVQFSLEGELGTQVVYDLRLERPRPSGAPMRLAVRGLPVDVPFEFREPDGRARIGQLRFADGATAARVQLAVALPARPSAALRPDVPLAFEVTATDDGGTTPRTAGGARLEVVPRGVARLELRPATLALETRADAAPVLAVTVRNAGSGRVEDVRPRADLPPHWQGVFRPATLGGLAAGEERRVTLELRPPAPVAVGDYELRVGVDAGAARRIDVEDKLVRVRIIGGGGITVPLLGGSVTVLLATALVVYGRRWINR